MPEPKFLIIGGLVFNQQPLNQLNRISAATEFIDINIFNTAFENIVKECAAKLTAVKQHIIAYSCGGLIALRLAHDFPDLISSLVLINSTPNFIAHKGWNGIKVQDFCRLEEKLDKLSLEQFKRHFAQLAAYPNPDKSVIADSWLSSLCSKNSLKNWLRLIRASDLRPEAARLKIPLLYLYSAQDILVPQNNTHAQQYILSKSTHANLNEAELIGYLQEFIACQIL